MRLVLALLLLSACATLKRAVTIDSRETARVIDARTGEVFCPRTPCQVEADRFWSDVPERRFRLLRAVSELGAVEDMTLDTAAVKDGQTIRFEFRPKD